MIVFRTFAIILLMFLLYQWFKCYDTLIQCINFFTWAKENTTEEETTPESNDTTELPGNCIIISQFFIPDEILLLIDLLLYIFCFELQNQYDPNIFDPASDTTEKKTLTILNKTSADHKIEHTRKTSATVDKDQINEAKKTKEGWNVMFPVILLVANVALNDIYNWTFPAE